MSFGFGNMIPFAGTLAQMFMKRKNPADSAMSQLDKISPNVWKYYQPFIEGGQKDYDILQNEFIKNIQNPQDLYNNIASSYRSSPEFDFKNQQATSSLKNAMASGGMLGTPMHAEKQQEYTNKLLSSDMNNYMTNILNNYYKNLSGLGGLEQQGYGMSGQMGDLEKELGSARAQYAYGGQASKNAQNAAMWSDLIKSLSGMFGDE